MDILRSNYLPNFTILFIKTGCTSGCRMTSNFADELNLKIKIVLAESMQLNNYPKSYLVALTKCCARAHLKWIAKKKTILFECCKCNKIC
jgi:hypothetical protein